VEDKTYPAVYLPAHAVPLPEFMNAFWERDCIHELDHLWCNVALTCMHEYLQAIKKLGCGINFFASIHPIFTG